MSRNISSRSGEWVIILIDNQDKVTKEEPAMFVSLRWILLSTYLIAGILPLFLITNIILHSMEDYFITERKAELLSQANMLAGQITSFDYILSDLHREDLEQTIFALGQHEDFRVFIFDKNSRIIYDTGYQDIGQTRLIPEVLEALEGKDHVKEQGNNMLYATVSILDDDKAPHGAVLIAEEISNISDIVSKIAQTGNRLLVMIAILVIVSTFILTKWFTEPIKKMIKVVQNMAEGHFDERVQVNFWCHNEVVDLALACNHMVEQLEKVDSSRQQFVLNVSHELKTPLSSVKVLSESILLQEYTPEEMYREFLEDINSEVDRMTAIINDLLTLVKLEQKEIPHHFQETDLNIMMEGIVKRLQPLAGVKEILIDYMREKEVFADVDQMKMMLALSNIVDNAIKYTPEQGVIQIILNADHQHAFIKVVDTGIGIPEEEQGQIFERFYRVDKTRDRQTGGTGLGLSITYATIMMHRGTIRVNSKEGEGTTMLVRIPLKQTI